MNVDSQPIMEKRGRSFFTSLTARASHLQSGFNQFSIMPATMDGGAPTIDLGSLDNLTIRRYMRGDPDGRCLCGDK
jgi:hypothetical protein